MKHIRIIALILAATVVLSCMISCTSSKEDLIGTWKTVKEEGVSFQCKALKHGWNGTEYRTRKMNVKELSLYSDGTARWNEDSVKWSFNDTELCITGSDIEITFQYTLKGSKLTLIAPTDDNNGERIVFKKQ